MFLRCIRKIALLPIAAVVLVALNGCSGDGANVSDNTLGGVQLDTTTPPSNGGTPVPLPLPQAGSPQAIDAENLGDVESFSAVVDGSGNVTVVWTQWDGVRNNLWGNRYDVSNGWGNAQILEDLSGTVSSAQMVVDGAGNVTVVWVQEHEGSYIIPGSSGPSPAPPVTVKVKRTDLWAKRYEAGNGWTAEVRLEANDLAMVATENLADIGEVKLVADGNADVTVVWSQHDGTRYNLFGLRNVSGAWDAAPVLLESENLGDAGSPSIVRDGNDLLVVWLQSDGVRQNLWAKWYNAGWAASNKIDSEDLGDVSAPDAVIDAAGDAVMVWRQYDGVRWNLWSARYAAAVWGAAETLESENMGDVTSPQMVMESNGNVMVVWSQSNGTVSNVWARHFASGAWAAEAKIEVEDSGNVGSPLLVIDGANEITAAWTQGDGSVTSLWVNRFSGSWGTAAKIEALDNGDVRSPILMVDSANRVMAVWNQFDGNRYDLWSNLYSAGSWGSAELVESLDSGSVIDPHLILDGNDRLIAVWQQPYASRNHLLVNAYTPGSGWGTVGQIDPDDRDSGFAPMLLLDGLNNVTVLWQQPESQLGSGSRVDLWANRF